MRASLPAVAPLTSRLGVKRARGAWPTQLSKGPMPQQFGTNEQVFCFVLFKKKKSFFENLIVCYDEMPHLSLKIQL